MRYLVIGLKGVTKKNIQMERMYSFIHQKKGSILKETFKKEVSNKLTPKIKPTRAL